MDDINTHKSGVYRFSARINPAVKACCECSCATTSRCPHKGTPLCNVCNHLLVTSDPDDEPVTARHSTQEIFEAIRKAANS